MPMTLAEKILARKCGRAEVAPGDLVTCPVDRVMATDITAPLSIDVFRRMGAARVFDPAACILVNDHFVPAKDIRAADFSRAMRRFATEQGIADYYEVGRSGICHILIAERRLVLPGQLLVGADSHTCTAGALGAFATGVGSTDLAAVWALGEIWLRVPETIRVELQGALGPWVTSKDLALHLTARLGLDGARYAALEFGGPLLARLPMAQRLTLCNMSVETGAKTGLVPPDEITLSWFREAGVSHLAPLLPDPGASYARTETLDATGLEPQVAEPFGPDRVGPVSSFRGICVDQVFLGSCTNGSLEDLRDAASVLRGRAVARGVRCIVTPATQGVYLAAAREGLLADFAEAGAAVTAPTCGACLGAHSGVLGTGETALATTNRNFRGRMGDATSRVYLANPFVAAATAVAGHIASPEELP